MGIGQHVGKRFDALTDAVTERAKHYVAVTRTMVASVGSDLQTVAAAGEERLTQSIDTILADEKLGELVQTVRQYAKDGYDGVREALRKKAKAYDAYMDGIAGKRPDLAGLSDGFLNSYLDTPCNRKPRSQVYKAHVQYGKVIGVASAFAFLTVGKGYQRIVGLVPVITRGIEYLKKKVVEADAQVRARAPAS